MVKTNLVGFCYELQVLHSAQEGYTVRNFWEAECLNLFKTHKKAREFMKERYGHDFKPKYKQDEEGAVVWEDSNGNVIAIVTRTIHE